MGRFKKPLLLFVKFALTVFFLWLLVKGVDIKAVWKTAQSISTVMLAIGLLLEVMQIAITAYRWQFVLHSIDEHLSYPLALEIAFIGNFFSQVLPGAVGGDIVRIWKTKQVGLPTRAAINSVILERIATVLGLMLLVVVTVPFFAMLYHAPFSMWTFPALLLVIIIGIGMLMLLDRLSGFLNDWKHAHHFVGLAQDTRRVFLHPVRGLWLIAVVVVGHLNQCLIVWVLALGLGVHLSILYSVVLVPPVILLATLPISIAGWGVRELAMVAAFSLIGIPNAQALVVSVLFGLIGIVVSLPGGVAWICIKRNVKNMSVATMTGTN